jgi:hypothetical protein
MWAWLASTRIVQRNRWLGVVAATVLVALACGPAQPSRSSPARVPAASSARQEPRPCSDVKPPTWAPSSPSNANLEIVQFKGSNTYLVRDITDILHPVTLSTFTALYVSPQFVSAGEVSFIDAAGLELMRVAGSPRTLITRCALLFAWSPDGTTLAFVSENEELHLVTSGHNRVVATMPTWPGGYGCESQGCADDWEFRLRYSPNGAFISLIQWPPGEFRIWTSGGNVLAGSDYTSTDPNSHRTMSAWSGNTFYFRDEKGVEMWRSGTESLLLAGVSWIRPNASPGGGQIVYETRDAAGTAHMHLLDTASEKVRGLADARSEPAFLNSHLIWYQEERPCAPTDKCIAGPTIPTGRTFIYDLADGTETESKIAYVSDSWPHPA